MQSMSLCGGPGTSRGKRVLVFLDLFWTIAVTTTTTTLLLLLLLPVTQSFAAMPVNQQQQNDNGQQPSFAFVESSIGKVLALLLLEEDDNGTTVATCSTCSSARQKKQRLSVDETTPLCLRLLLDTTTTTTTTGTTRTDVVEPSTKSKDTMLLSVTDLIPLARQCDQLIFPDHADGSANTNSCRPHCQDCLQALRQDALICLVRSKQQHFEEKEKNGDCDDDGDDDESTTTDTGCWVLMSTLLALNTLESSIRQATGFTTAKAPLLTIMLQKLQQQPEPQPHTIVLIQVLRLVLLPTGLNFRNMLWHGFIGQDLPRPWLALVVYLTHQVRQTWNTTTDEIVVPNDDDNAMSTMTPNNKQQEEVVVPQGLRHLSSVHPRMQQVVKQGSQIRQSIIQTTTTTRQMSTTTLSALNNILLWLPSEHGLLWHFVCHLMSLQDCKCPWICVTLLVLLLEHGLRLDWCRVNKEKDTKAVSGQFYVTLDGHGQKHKHNLLLHPFVYDDASFIVVGSESSLPSQPNASNATSTTTTTTTPSSAHRNKLIPLIGAETMALLTDLFMSPAEDSPNVRAALSHGLLDECLEQEILHLVASTSNNDIGLTETRMPTAPVTICDENHTWDIVDAVLVALDRIAAAAAAATSHNDTLSSSHYHEGATNEALRQYRPIFSYTAITVQRLQALDEQLQRFHETVMHHSNLIDKCKGAVLVPESILMDFSFPSNQLEHEMKLVSDLLLMGHVDRKWTVDLLYSEHAISQRLAPLGATQLLLLDLSRVLSTYLDEFERASSDTTGLNNKRAQRRRTRIIATGSVAHHFFLFATYVSLVSLHKGLDPTENSLNDFTSAEILQATKRTRMVVSTVDTFLLVNAERAFKAIDGYQKGKIVKKLLGKIV